MIVFLHFGLALALASAAGDGVNKRQNLWEAHIKGGEEVARGVARDLGLKYEDKGVRWARQQVISEDSKYHLSERSLHYIRFDDVQEQAELNSFLKSVNSSSQSCEQGPFACITFPSHQLDYLRSLGQTDVNKIGTFSTSPASESTLSTYTGPTRHLKTTPKQLSAYALKFNDPEWRNQWYMQDYRTSNYPVMDHNVVPVLNMKITGRTVTVGVIGDGVMEHPDLADNFDTSESYDFCEKVKGSVVPSWSWSLRLGYTYDSHGTGSAGVIAMKAGNNICGVGIAPDARIVGLKIRGCATPQYDMEASALNYNFNDIDIYCNTWTNDDEEGKELIIPSYTVKTAFKRGVLEGRNKKGSIYVFPSGASRKNSNCAANGYINNPYVITIASASNLGKPTYFSDSCTAVFATAYSGDHYTICENIPTVSADGGCANYDRNKPLGPAMASGIFALVLQYKPSLTYRDMMHLIAMTAEVAPLANSRYVWYRNGKGFFVSNNFGFGLLNAENMIDLAKDWKTVPEKHICVLRKKLDKPMYFDQTEMKIITIDASKCKGPGKGIVYLEHVELSSTIDYFYRGAIYMNLTSPAGTSSIILDPRTNDQYSEGIKNWNIMSLHNWGENPKGKWEITVMANPVRDKPNIHGFIKDFNLTLHGTEEKPDHYDRPRKYAAVRLPNGDTNSFT